MKQQHRHQQYHRRYHPHRRHRSNLDIVVNILELVLTGVGNRNKIIHKASLAYEQQLLPANNKNSTELTTAVFSR
jgi:hypothetical protein